MESLAPLGEQDGVWDNFFVGDEGEKFLVNKWLQLSFSTKEKWWKIDGDSQLRNPPDISRLWLKLIYRMSRMSQQVLVKISNLRIWKKIRQIERRFALLWTNLHEFREFKDFWLISWPKHVGTPGFLLYWFPCLNSWNSLQKIYLWSSQFVLGMRLWHLCTWNETD